MLMLVNCSHCRTPLQLPPGAPSIRCAICQAITSVAAAPPAGPPYQHGPPPPSPYPHGPPPPSPYPPPAPTFTSTNSFNGHNNTNYYNPPPPTPPPSAHGRKKAVIVGISYKKSTQELKGCINDAKCMKFMLISRFNFPESSIIMLTEEETDPHRIPTKHNIRLAMFWLVQGCQAGDSLVFHFSGHGGQQKNHNGDELDGFDETLCPLDYETKGMIVDDEVNSTLVKPLPAGVKLHAIIDSCHSGTVLDLPYLCRMDRSGRNTWEDHRPRSGAWKGTSGGEVISFSGCDDDQTSADTSALSKVTSTGAMTFAFIQAVEKGQGQTYGSILSGMRSTIRKTDAELAAAGAAAAGPTTLLSMLLTGGNLASAGLTQEPQLSSNEPFDIYTKPFSL